MDIAAKPWRKNKQPKRILAIRLHATGDVVITLPYLQFLKQSLPINTEIDFLTTHETKDIAENLVLFHRVYAIGRCRNFKMWFLHTCLLMPKIMFNNYDVVLDLQNNIFSRMIRKAALPKAWCEFDRFSPSPAGKRNQRTIEAIGLGKVFPMSDFKFKSQLHIDELLLENGWQKNLDTVVLNPAGAFENRHWPVENYIEFARLWLERFPSTQFLVLGVDKIAFKAKLFKDALGQQLVNLVNKTIPSQAFAILQKCQFVLSEDSGLMHMAWVSGIPTFVMFGSTRSDWARPLGKYTNFLDSSDLKCGNCMLEKCKYLDERKNHCITRYTPEYVFKKSIDLLESLKE